MPTISKIRFTNVVYEGGNKRYADEIFHFQGENGAIVLENGGGKTVFIQTALQAIIPHSSLANRKVKDTYTFDDGPAHIAIEWIKNDRPRIYALTAVTLFPHQNSIDSYRFVNEYGPNDPHRIENLPFTQELANGQKRIASHAEMKEYYGALSQKSQNAQTFSTITAFTEYIEKNFQIISDEWKAINTINSAEGDVEKFFESCPTEKALYEKLLIPTVEQSIAAYNKHQFVDIFEKHRDKFKLYKQLNAQLKEYDLIQKELSNYVKVVHTLHEHELKYEAEKQKGKAFYQKLTHLLEEHEKKITAYEEQQTQLHVQLQNLEHKQKSYDIAVMEEKLAELIANFDEIEKELILIEEKFNCEQQLFGNLKYATASKSLKLAEEQLQFTRKQLKQLDEEHSTEQLLEQLDDVKANIHGELIAFQEKFDAQVKVLQLAERQKQEEVAQQQEKVTQFEGEHRQLTLTIEGFKSELKIYESQKEELAKKVFEDELQRQQPILELRTTWTKQSQKLDSEIVELKNTEKTITIQKQQDASARDNTNHQLIDLKGQEKAISQQIETIEVAEKKLLEEVILTLPRVSEKTSLYLKQSTLLQELTQLLEKKERIYSNKLQEERMAYRFMDDYGEQETFFADPYVAKRLASWKDKFSYLETAIEYAMSEEKLAIDTQLLAITLITTDHEKDKLEQLVQDCANYLTNPIQIWTLSEVVAFSNGEQEATANLIQPDIWLKLRDLENFHAEQQHANEKALLCKNNREIADNERTHVKALLTKLNDFYSQYPFVQYQQLKESLKQVESKTYELSNELQLLTNKIQQAEEKLEHIHSKVEEKNQQKKFVDEKIQSLLEYDKKDKLIQGTQQQLTSVEQRITAYEKQLATANDTLDYLKNELSDVNVQIQQVKLEFEVQKAERTLYKGVLGYKPKFSGIEYETLAQQYEQIDQQIKGLNSSRQHIEQLITHYEAQMKAYNNELAQIKIEYSDVDEAFDLPIDAERKLQLLPETIRNLRKDLAKAEKKRQSALSEKDQQEGALNSKRAELGNPIHFDIPLPNVKYQLDLGFERLSLQQKQLQKNSNAVEAELTNLHKLELDMRILNAEHSYLAPAVQAASLLPEEENDFMYRKQHYVGQLERHLKDYKGLIARHYDVASKSKSDFIQFCTQRVSEVRLRNTIIDGLKSKDRYEDLVKHQVEMEKTIHMSRQYVERDLKKHDEDLVQFVQRIHIHLRKVVEELKHIPRKTKVQIGDEDVTIYKFTIPDWTDEEGIVQIRARIDWIMEQLEQLELRGTDEQEMKQKSRKQLEEWLSTVQLLRYITQNKEWRVSCKKVMNDNRISKSYETWSRSNAWSGGEKWSKNMALFLGVLNYVAEKRQYINSKKKSRTVLLDNPFGKASSDHVLSPVFFIAKQLGFQIIALTAHVEGKFLHDYFPVVYSCRLREAVGVDKLVMETKKSMHQAYFQDKNEDAGDVINEEQLSLFEVE